MKIALLALLVLVSIYAPLNAQDSDAGWPIVERCVGEPTAPPEDWTFEGTILMTGSYGIHAVSADFETPYVVAFIDDNESLITRGSSGLSPNAEWYGVIEGETFYADFAFRVFVRAIGIRVYSTSNPLETHQVSWENEYDFGMNGFVHGMAWLGNDQLIYESNTIDGGGKFIINPFTGEYTRWSPLQVETVQIKAPADGVLEHIIWSADNTFAVVQTLENDDHRQLSLYNRNGELTDVILAHVDNLLPGIEEYQTLALSFDGKILAFTLDSILHFADLESSRIINTCLPIAYGVAWSRTENKLTFFTQREWRKQIPVVVFDLQLFQPYIVAYHRIDGLMDFKLGVLGWRAD